ncbi:MAG TPA: ExbD/TolR family protein [Kofleriaceae bacterium]|nr:ExbD/TolR family protein [Kofleriaceae bacterium]
MGMGTGGGGASGPGEDLNSEINVTPFVDVMLVLLVIFMVTAPMLTTGVDIDLPETEAAVIEDTEGKLVLSISKQRQLFLGAAKVKWADLQVKLSTNERVKLEKTLWIEADQTLPYAVVVTAMAQARAAGVTKLMMLTDANQQVDMAKLDEQVGTAAPADTGAP